MSNEEKNRYRGMAGTAIFHAVLLVLFLLFGFRTPLPLPAEQGIAINFGTSDEGMGDLQPERAADLNQQNDQAASAASQPSSSSTERPAVTQDIEDAPAVRPVTKPNDTRKPTEAVKKPVETPVVEEPKPRVDPRALYPGGGSGASGGSQGQTGKPGDQGSPDGSRDTDRQGEGGRGGLSGSPDFSLAGRQITQRPTIADRSQNEGKIVVWIWVDRVGRVLRSQAGAPGTTLQTEALWRKCEQAALNARFSPNDDVPEEQRGTMTFIFKLQ
jgi:protein TonB